MRVGIDAHAVGSGSSGNETYYQQLLDHLAKLPSNNSRYVIFYTHPLATQLIPASNKFRLKCMWPRTPLWRISIGFPLEFRTEKLDVFHAQFIIPPFTRCRTVTFIPDIAFEHYPGFFSRIEGARSRLLTRRSAERADQIITLSEFSRKDIAETYHVDPAKIAVTHCGAGPDYYPRDKARCQEQICEKYKIKGPFLLYVGRIQERKNLRRLISAFARLRKAGANEKLVLVGKKGWMTEELQSHVNSLALEDEIVLTGYVPSADLPVFYNAAEAFVYPSIFEGFGLPVIEAMSCGLPVLTSFGSSLEEVVGEAAVLADPLSEDSIASALAKLLGDPSFRERLGKAGLARSAAFSYQRMAEQTVAVYEKVASTPS